MEIRAFSALQMKLDRYFQRGHSPSTFLAFAAGFGFNDYVVSKSGRRRLAQFELRDMFV